METAYDWMSISITSALIVMFLQRSLSDSRPRDHLWQYITAMTGCAFANYLGNKGYDAAAVAALLLVLAFVQKVLKPFDRSAG